MQMRNKMYQQSILLYGIFISCITFHIYFYAVYGAVSFLLVHISCGDFENMCTYLIILINRKYNSVFRVRSWNNGMHSCYVLTVQIYNSIHVSSSNNMQMLTNTHRSCINISPENFASSHTNYTVCPGCCMTGIRRSCLSGILIRRGSKLSLRGWRWQRRVIRTHHGIFVGNLQNYTTVIIINSRNTETLICDLYEKMAYHSVDIEWIWRKRHLSAVYLDPCNFSQ